MNNLKEILFRNQRFGIYLHVEGEESLIAIGNDLRDFFQGPPFTIEEFEEKISKTPSQGDIKRVLDETLHVMKSQKWKSVEGRPLPLRMIVHEMNANPVTYFDIERNEVILTRPDHQLNPERYVPVESYEVYPEGVVNGK